MDTPPAPTAIFAASDVLLNAKDATAASKFIALNEYAFETFHAPLGSDAEKVSFDFVISEFLGMTGVQQALDKLRLYMENGRVLPLVIGTKSYGRYRWLIQSLDASKNIFDGRGKLLSTHVSVSLIEYLKR